MSINASAAAKAVIAAADSTRNLKSRIKIKVVDPDLVPGTYSTSGENVYSDSSQIMNGVVAVHKYSTNERCSTLLDGTWEGMPDSVAGASGEFGYVGDELSGDDGTYSGSPTYPFFDKNISGVSLMRAAGVAFSGLVAFGYAVDFDVEIYSGETLAHTEEVRDNTKQIYTFEGFSVYTPTRIKVIVYSWNLPGRYVRISEIIPGSYEDWSGSTIHTMELQRKADFSCLSLPYGSMRLVINNENFRFDARNKSGLFESLEARQAFENYINAKLSEDEIESIPAGVYYLLPNGWKSLDDGYFYEFSTVDLLGLLVGRRFVPPEMLPTTCEGWVAEIVSQLGVNFEGLYYVDPTVASTEMICSAGDVENVTCGDLLRWICMYVECPPRVSGETGYLVVAPLSSVIQGEYTLENNDVPKLSANDDIALLAFRLNDGSSTPYSVNGTSATATETRNISNPFITTESAAARVARYILSWFGGQLINYTGLGDPSTDIGDAISGELGLDSTASGFLMNQQLRIDKDGIMDDVTSTLIQSTGSLAFKEHVEITEDGSWTPPAGCSYNGVPDTALAILIGRGEDGEDGLDGQTGAGMPQAGTPGPGGLGGKIYSTVISVTPETPLATHIGVTGDVNTTLGGHSSASGSVLNGWTDAVTGKVYGRNGADGIVNLTPTNGTAGEANTGNGGGGGSGGTPDAWTMVPYTVTFLGTWVWTPETGTVFTPGGESYTDYYVTKVSPAAEGGDGAEGGSGAIIIMYDK